MEKIYVKKNAFFLLMGMLFPLLSFSQIPADRIIWKFSSDAAIVSTPTVRNNIIYIGNMDGDFYAIDAKTGVSKWDSKVSNPINSSAAIRGNVVCIEAGSALYGFDANNGILMWRFVANNVETVLSVDPTDYHHSSPVIENDVVYFGDEWGNINGVNIRTGKGVFKYTTPAKKAIRTTPVIKDNIIYFGDWEGMVYAVSIPAKSLKWQYKMENTRPNYGAIISEMVIRDGTLYFGSQHDTYSPLDIKTGKPQWSFIDPDKTYLPSTPVFYKKDLIVGSTINAFKIFCFSEGKVKWTIPTKGVFFIKPVIFQDSILVMNSSSFGKTGYLYFIDCKNGKLISETPIEEATPCSPFIINDMLILGRKNGLMAIDTKPFLMKK
jgi:eukaryotic-like serine/threonine-protein kinase